MPILAVTLGAEEDEEAAAHSTAPVAMLPMVSEAQRSEVMYLIWANFEVRYHSVLSNEYKQKAMSVYKQGFGKPSYWA